VEERRTTETRRSELSPGDRIGETRSWLAQIPIEALRAWSQFLVPVVTFLVVVIVIWIRTGDNTKAIESLRIDNQTKIDNLTKEVTDLRIQIAGLGKESTNDRIELLKSQIENDLLRAKVK